ncbi:MAG: dNTP triphosphohydrolase [Chloroflexota bacterium]|nr:dNTP triphosphohydrolase [Chloroflexota bacterium]
MDSDGKRGGSVAHSAPSTQYSALSFLRTPETAPYTDRRHAAPRTSDDPRPAFAHDRDRIIHADAFRRLQHKTQVMVVSEGDFFRTRLTHTLETAQIGRAIATLLDLSEPLTEAICLGHDLGHTPFGHTGETALNAVLADQGGWDSNFHSLVVVEEIEVNYADYPGLDLTWACREGIARHQTPFDLPVTSGDYVRTAQPSLEAQVCNLADVIAYATHDVQDAIESRMLALAHLQGWAEANDCRVWLRSAETARREVPDIQTREALFVRRIRRHMINSLISDVQRTSLRRVAEWEIASLDAARAARAPLIGFGAESERDVQQLIAFLLENVYRGPVIARQAYKARYIMEQLFVALSQHRRLLPQRWRAMISPALSQQRVVAYYLASLTDRGAIDLYNELFLPSERSLGHHI